MSNDSNILEYNRAAGYSIAKSLGAILTTVSLLVALTAMVILIGDPPEYRFINIVKAWFLFGLAVAFLIGIVGLILLLMARASATVSIVVCVGLLIEAIIWLRLGGWGYLT